MLDYVSITYLAIDLLSLVLCAQKDKAVFHEISL
jgi:hypothetical protein